MGGSDEAVTTWLCGVLEGGGAKGAAYGPALRALRDEGCWFASVAGASAGAITAALIAAGYRPEEIEEKTFEALDLIAPRGRLPARILRGWSNLRRDPPRTSDIAPLETFIEGLLVAKARAPGAGPDGPVSFRELHQATGIELFMVAVDAVGKSEYVFHHELTPEASVSRAATSSAAIPFYFPPRVVPAADGREIDAILFDGGMWSNFPTWIYRDVSFSTYHFGESRYTGGDGSRAHPFVLGLLLDEGRSAAGEPVSIKAETRANNSFRRHPFFVTLFSIWSSPLTFAALLIAAAANIVVLASLAGPDSFMHSVLTAWNRRHHGLFIVAILAIALVFLRQLYQALRRGTFRVRDIWSSRAKETTPFLGYDRAASEIFFGAPLSVALVVGADQFVRLAAGATTPGLHIGTATAVIAGLCAFMVAAIVVLWMALLVSVAPPAVALLPWIVPTLTSAGGARYWVGDAPEDYVMRLGVGGIGTLDFARARGWLTQSGDEIYADVRRQWQDRRAGNAAMRS